MITCWKLPHNQTTLHKLQTNDEMHINMNKRIIFIFTGAEHVFLTCYCDKIFHLFSPFVPHVYTKYNNGDKHRFSRKEKIIVKK